MRDAQALWYTKPATVDVISQVHWWDIDRSVTAQVFHHQLQTLAVIKQLPCITALTISNRPKLFNHCKKYQYSFIYLV
jgi:hypothetical protein